MRLARKKGKSGMSRAKEGALENSSILRGRGPREGTERVRVENMVT